MDWPTSQTALAQRGRVRWELRRRCRCPFIFNIRQLPRQQRWWSWWGRMGGRRYTRPKIHRSLWCRRQRERSFIGEQMWFVVIEIFGDFRWQRWRWRQNRYQRHQQQWRRQQRRWQEYCRRRRVNGMAKVPYLKRATRSVGRYGKCQSILVDSIEKKTKLGKSKSKIAQKVKAAQRSWWTCQEQQEKKRGFTEVSETTTSREARLITRSACKKNWHKKSDLSP